VTRRRHNFYLSPRDRDVLDRALAELIARSDGEPGEGWRAYHEDAIRLRANLEDARFRLAQQDFRDRFS